MAENGREVGKQIQSSFRWPNIRGAHTLSDIFQQITGGDMTKELTGPDAPFMVNSFYYEEGALEWLLSWSS